MNDKIKNHEIMINRRIRLKLFINTIYYTVVLSIISLFALSYFSTGILLDVLYKFNAKNDVLDLPNEKTTFTAKFDGSLYKGLKIIDSKIKTENNVIECSNIFIDFNIEETLKKNFLTLNKLEAKCENFISKDLISLKGEKKNFIFTKNELLNVLNIFNSNMETKDLNIIVEKVSIFKVPFTNVKINAKNLNLKNKEFDRFDLKFLIKKQLIELKNIKSN